LGSPLRDRPLRTRKERPKVEEDDARRAATKAAFPIPNGPAEFKEGYRECLEMFSIHSPNKRAVSKILDEHCVTLEDACMRSMTRENVARYEGYRACLKELRRIKKIK